MFHTLRRPRFAFLAAALGLAAATPAVSETLTLRATGEDLATQGFQTPELSGDGWALTFTHVIATFGDIAAWRTDPPFAADGPAPRGESVALPGTFTVDLARADGDGRITLTSAAAAPGHYNALTWALLPAPEGEHAGRSLVLEGVATRGDAQVPFILHTSDTLRHACGEFVGDARKGFVTATSGGDLEITLHLDHLFGRADLGPENAMNRAAPGFDAFAEGGAQAFSLAGLHLGHVGEGHCHVSLD
jgi:hypothetical protein